MRGNAVSYGHQALTSWADRSGSLGASAISTCGRLAEEGAAAAASQAEGLHGDPTLATVMQREFLHYVGRAVRRLCDHDEDMARMIAAHYLEGMKVEQAAQRIGVERRRGNDLLWCAQAWVGSWLMQHVPRHVVDGPVSDD